MRRITALLVVMLVAAATAAGHDAIGAGSSTRIELGKTDRGRVLTNGQGFTLYVFTRDRRHRDRCVAIAGCASIWPLVRARGMIVAGSGIRRSLLATVRLAHGARQITYAGHPLYTYAGDAVPRSTAYIGAHQFGGSWYAIRASGRLVR
jgi:predicted lipoprotein with Yx(FWY)xxD motif